MVAVHPPVAVVYDRAAGRRSAGVGVAVIALRLGVGPREECFHRFPDGVSPAEGTHDAFLGGRVLLLRCQAFLHRLLAFRGRPLRSVVPVAVHVEDAVHPEEVLVVNFHDIFAVPRDGRPEHEPVELEGSRVAVVDPDQLGHFPADRLILLHAHRAVCRDDHAQPRGCRPVLAGRIDRCRAAQVLHLGKYLPCLLGRDVVQVERDHVTAPDVSYLAVPALDHSADKPANVLTGVLVRLGHFQELAEGLGAADRVVKPPAELRPSHHGSRPRRRPAR